MWQRWRYELIYARNVFTQLDSSTALSAPFNSTTATELCCVLVRPRCHHAGFLRRTCCGTFKRVAGCDPARIKLNSMSDRWPTGGASLSSRSASTIARVSKVDLLARGCADTAAIEVCVGCTKARPRLFTAACESQARRSEGGDDAYCA